MDRDEIGGDRPGTRAVTPALGVVLLIAGVIALAVIVAPFIFSATQDVGDSAPDVDLAFGYSEEVDGSVEDTFGNTAGDVNADGLLTITLEGGSALDATRVSVEGAASGGPLTAGSYSDGDQVRVGEEITVWIDRGDTIDVIWESDSEDESDILDQFTVFPLNDLPPGAPDPDHSCDGWVYPDDFDDVDGITADSNDLILNGVVLECDLTEYSIPNVEINSGGGLIGNAEADGNFKVLGNSGVWGEFVRTTGGGNVELDGESGIDAEVDASGNVRMDGESAIDGTVDVEGTLNIQSHSDITDDVTISSDNIDADSATFGGDVTLTDDATFENLDDTYVSGSIHATDGDNVKLQNGSTVVGDVFVEDGDDLECADGNGSTINGEGCENYKEPEFAVTIDDTNSPVKEGSVLKVNATIENVGYEDDTQTITLEIDGTQEDATSVTLDDGATTTETLEWSTGSGDQGDHTATVASDNDSDATDVTVNPPNPPKIDQFVTSEIPGNGNIGIEVDWDVSAGDADLDTVLIEIIDPVTGTVVDSTSHSVSGTAANGNDQFTGLVNGKTYDVKLTVTDLNGIDTTDTKQQQAG